MRGLFGVALLIIGCVHTPPAKSLTGFRLEVEPTDSELTVDGQVLGPVSQVPLTEGVLELQPGVHQMSLKRKGYQTWRGEVAVGASVESLKVSLVKR